MSKRKKTMSMKSWMGLIGMLLFFLLLVLQTPAAEAKPITLIINNTFPSTHHLHLYAYKPWMKEVEEKTQGRVKVQIYHGGTLGKMTTTIEDTAAGKYHVTMNVPSYKYDKHILPIIGEAAFAFPSTEVGYRVINRLVDKYSDIVEKEFEEVEIMGFSLTDPYILWSKTPVRSIDDLKGKLVSLKSKSFKKVIEAWSSTPVSVATPEAYTALQRGTIDVLTYSQIGGCGYKFYEVAPYITKTNMWSFVLTFIMNKKFFNSLPNDLKKLFKDELNPRLAEICALEDYAVNGEKYMKEIKKNAKEVITLSSEEHTKFVASGKPAWDYWLAKAKKQNIPAEQIMADFKKLIKEESGK